MEFVVNEWLPEYFRPTAAPHEKEKLETFLNKFMVKNDKLFVRRPSEFLNKIYRFSKMYQDDLKVYQEIKKFITIILQDSDRCLLVDDDEFELSKIVTSKLIDGGNTISDVYLFEAASMTNSKSIITTDARLKVLMEGDKTFNVILLDDFLLNY